MTAPFDRPVDRVLLALREAGPDAYRSAGSAAWDAFCPACGSRAEGNRTLRLTESDEGARLRCKNGCQEAIIYAALGLPVDGRTDSTPKELGAVQRNRPLPFAPLAEAIASAPEEPEWRWRSYVAPGVVTLLAGRPKTGKSTLVCALIEAMLAGRPFLGRSASCRGVLLLSEERPVTIAEKARRFHLDSGSGVHLLTRQEAHGVRWPAVVEQAVAYCEERGLDVLVVDTWDKWTGLKGDDENKAGAILAALEPLMRAASKGLAVVVVAHQRKAPGELGEAVRGSNALTGAVDVVVEVERARSESPTVRMLQAVSRFGSTPERLGIELDGAEYRLADLETSANTQNAVIDAAVAAVDGKPTASEISAQTGIGESTVRRRLEERYAAGEMVRTGTGKRGDPYRWALSTIVCTAPTALDGANNPDRPVAAAVNPAEHGALVLEHKP